MRTNVKHWQDVVNLVLGLCFSFRHGLLPSRESGGPCGTRSSLAS